MRFVQTALLLALLCMCAIAQDKPAAKASGKSKSAKSAATSMPMPKPSPEMEKMSKTFLGTWTTSEKMEPGAMSPEGATGKGTATFKNGPGNMSVVEDYKSAGGFVGHGTYWWDSKAGGYQGVWCDNMSPKGCSVGTDVAKWVGNDLVEMGEEDMHGQKLQTKVTYSDITPKSFTMTMQGGPTADQVRTWMTIKFTRSGAMSASKETKSDVKK